MPRLDSTTGTKECCKCHIVYSDPYEAFTKDRRMPDGLNVKCRECHNAYDRGYYEVNNEQRREYHREYMKEYDRKRYEADKESYTKRRVDYIKERRRSDPAYRKYVNDWRAARRRGLTKDGTVTEKALWALLDTWTGICPFCNREAEPTIDHIIPVSRGGEHSMSNLGLMCLLCNASKNDKTMDEWLDSRKSG